MRLIVIKNDYGKEQQMLQIDDAIAVDEQNNKLQISWVVERHSKELVEPFYLPKSNKFMDAGTTTIELKRSNNIHEQVQEWLNEQTRLQNKRQSELFKKTYRYVYIAGLPNPSRYDLLEEE